jgi:hypothetical protein
MTAEEQSAAWCVPPEEIWFRAVLLKITDAIEDAAEITCMPQTAQNPASSPTAPVASKPSAPSAKKSSAPAPRLSWRRNNHFVGVNELVPLRVL